MTVGDWQVYYTKSLCFLNSAVISLLWFYTHTYINYIVYGSMFFLSAMPEAKQMSFYIPHQVRLFSEGFTTP